MPQKDAYFRTLKMGNTNKAAHPGRGGGELHAANSERAGK
jgi:hypothetical protein